jgi:hypothetical protein
MAMVLSLAANSTLAQKRWKIIEMGESCQPFAILMSEEECAAEDAEKARLEEIRAARKKEESIIRFVTFEMCESSETVSFPMSAEEIQKAMSSGAEQPKEALAREKEQKIAHTEIELCESGEKIIFYELP